MELAGWYVRTTDFGVVEISKDASNFLMPTVLTRVYIDRLRQGSSRTAPRCVYTLLFLRSISMRVRRGGTMRNLS